MKKIIVILALIAIFAACFAGCEFNKQILDTNYKFNYAYVSAGDKIIAEGPVKSWTDYEDCDMVQVTFTDGTVYYTHGSNIVLIYGD